MIPFVSITHSAPLANSAPVLTFSQPLYWNGLTIIAAEANTSPIKKNRPVVGWLPHTHELRWGCWIHYGDSLLRDTFKIIYIQI